MKGELTQEGSFITFICENCSGSGEVERNSDGMDYPAECMFCEGTGLEKFDREYIEKIFEQRNAAVNQKHYLENENKELKEAVKSLIGLAELGAERAADNSRPEERSAHLKGLLTIISGYQNLIQDKQSKKL